MDEAEDNIGYVKIVWKQGLARPCFYTILTYPMLSSASYMCSYNP
jgi:hypothetical protein